MGGASIVGSDTTSHSARQCRDARRLEHEESAMRMLLRIVVFLSLDVLAPSLLARHDQIVVDESIAQWP
jgi:hypothetical protein